MSLSLTSRTVPILPGAMAAVCGLFGGARAIASDPRLAFAPMAGQRLHEARVRRVEAALATLPDHYLGSPDGLAARVEVRLSDLGRSWQIRLDRDRCRVITPGCGDCQVTIDTDSGTWLALREGRLSGLDAFASRRLEARGDIDLALGFEGLFGLSGGRPPLVRVRRVATGSGEISAITAGGGPEHVVCIHGLGASKTSFFPTIAALAPERTVHALDLPGFGASDKPAIAPYDATWFAGAVREYLDGVGIERAHLVGNSMGGRIALELALEAPERVRSLGLLAPALAFLRRRGFVPLVKLLRPELALLPHKLTEARVRKQFLSMLADPDRLDPIVADLACQEFLGTYRSRAARIAFYSAARNIYLDPPHGDRGLWTRLAGLTPPAIFVWGTHDRLVPAGFSRHVRDALPSARQVVMNDCGHVPQIEHAAETNRLLAEHLEGGAQPPAEPERPRRRLGGLRAPATTRPAAPGFG